MNGAVYVDALALAGKVFPWAWRMLPAGTVISITAPRFDKNGALTEPPQALR